MTFEEFSRRVEEIRLTLVPAQDSGEVAVGDSLKRKQEALKTLEQLSRALETASWEKEQVAQAVRELVTFRVAVENIANLENVQSQMGRVLSDAAGVKKAPGSTYSKHGRADATTEAPPSRVDRIT